MAQLDLAVIIKAVDRLTGPARRIVGRFKDEMGGARQHLDRSLATAGNLSLVGDAANRVSGTIVRALRSPIDTAMDFQASMDAVRAITGATGSQFDALRAKAAELGETTSFSASEAADGMRFLGMAGFNTNQILAAMPGVLDLAKAGAADLGRAADISSDILSGFGLTAEQMPRVGDVLTKTFTTSNTTLELLGESMKYVGPIARQFGTSIEEVAAMTGMLGNVGIKGSQAGTTLRAMFSRLSAPTGVAADTLEELGIQTRDAEGNMRSILDIIGDLNEATANMGAGEKLQILKEVFGEEPAAGVAELLSQGKEGIAKYVATLQEAGGTANRIAKQMGDNGKGAIKEYQSAIEGISITIGDVFIPMVTDAIKWATGLVREVGAWAKANPDLVRTIGLVAAGVAAVLAVVGPLSMVLSTLITTVGLLRFAFAGAWAILKFGPSLLMAIASGVKALSVALLTNPIGLIIGGIALAAGLIYANWESVGPWFAGLWDGIKSIASTAWEWLKELLGFTPLGLIIQNWEPIKGWFAGLWESIKGLLGSAWEWIQEKLLSPIQSIKGLLGSAWESLFGEDAPTVTQRVQQVVEPAKAAVAGMAMTAAVASGPAAATGTNPAASQVGGITVHSTIHIHATSGDDARRLADLVDQRIVEAVRKGVIERRHSND